MRWQSNIESSCLNNQQPEINQQTRDSKKEKFAPKDDKDLVAVYLKSRRLAADKTPRVMFYDANNKLDETENIVKTYLSARQKSITYAINNSKPAPTSAVRYISSPGALDRWDRR